MMSTVARIGGVLGAAAAFAVGMARGGLSAWMTGVFTAGALVLVAVVLLIPSETPARRLGQLIRAWRIPAEVPIRPERVQASAAPLLPSQDGR
jgi:hypothetical protein